MSEPAFPLLFSPVRLGPRVAPNRIMRLPTNSGMAERSRPTEAMIAYQVALARGGAGTIVTEACAVHAASTRGDKLLALFDRDTLPALTRLAQAVQAEGTLLIAQLVHGGRQHHATRITPTTWAPSAVACPYSGGVPHPMSADEIEEVIAGFALSAAHAREAGFAGVEIHGAQGYLIQQFASPLSNRRDDAYGGSLENRMRFALSVVDAVRDAAGADMVVGYRLGLEEFVPGGLTAEDARQIAAMLTATGKLDYLSASQGSFASIEMHLPDRHFAPGAFTPSHAALRPAIGDIPLVTCGRITDPRQAEAILASGDAQLIGLSRALTADAEWPAKARRGALRDIRPCIACNDCWAAITNGERLRCVVNPSLAQPDLPTPSAPTRPMFLVVVGGGPAGLEAARQAALSGAQVILWEASATLGGRLREAGTLPHQQELALLADHLAHAARAAGAVLCTGMRASLETILLARPGAVILATGASTPAPALPGDGSVACHEDIAALPPPDPARVVLVHDEDGHNAAAAIAEGVAALGHRVVLTTRFFEPLRGLPTVSRILALRELARLGAATRSNVEPVRISAGAVVLRDRITAQESSIEAAALLRVGATQPDDTLRQALAEQGIRHAVIGDAFAPRRIADALGDAARAVRALLAESRSRAAAC